MMIARALIAAVLLAAPALAQQPLPQTPEAKLAMARETVARLAPPGAVPRMMGAVMDTLPRQMMGQMREQRLA